MELVIKEKLVLAERRISISEFHTADEVIISYIHTFKSFLLFSFGISDY